MNHIKDDMKRLIASTGLVLLLAACGEAADQSLRVGPASSGSGSPYAGIWKLTSGRGPDGRVPVIREYPITLSIDRAVVGGTAACNSYGGDVTVKGSSFKIGAASMTQMACAPLVMRSQDAYLTALSQVDSVAREAGRLALTGRDTELTFALVPPPPTASLIETTWRLESIVQGRGPGGTVMSARPATLLLSANGTLEGSTGCRRLRGKWVEREAQIVVTRLAATGHCPQAEKPQDAHVVGVLGDGFTADVEGRELTIFSARGGSGLTYRAR